MNLNAKKQYQFLGLIIFLILFIAINAYRIHRPWIPVFSNEPQKTKGAYNAPISIVIFSDFFCSYCASLLPTVTKLLQTYPDKLKITYKHFPLDEIHPNARRVAIASECAADQKAFWAYHDVLFLNQNNLFETKNIDLLLTRYAYSVHLNTAEFEICLNSNEKEAIVERNKNEGKNLYISGTPTLILNSKTIMNKRSFENIKKQIDKSLASL